MGKTKVKESKKPLTLSKVVVYILLILLAITIIIPVGWVFVASVKQNSEFYGSPWVLPEKIYFQNFIDAWEKASMGTYMLNSVIVTALALLLLIVISLPAAYVLSRKNVMWKKPLMIFIMITMFFSGGLIPTYLNLKDLHLNNTLWGLIIPWLINTFNMIIMRTAFESIPDSLIEAAQIDGATHWRILRSIVLPLSKATIAVMVLYYGVEKWNGWFWASALIRDRGKLPLQVILREILLSSTQSMQTGAGSSDTEAIGVTIRYATTIVATVPILCVYPFIQKYFTKGVMIGAVKE